MKKILVLGVWVLIAIIDGCKGRGNTEKIGAKDVKMIGYGLFHEIKWEEETQVLISDSSDFIKYLYHAKLKPDSFTIAVIKRIKLDDSILIYYDDTTQFISSKIYNIDGKEREVRKYFSDARGVADGEYLVYWNDELGLISEQSQAWGDFSMFFYGNDKITEVLKADTLGLFDRFGD